MLIDAKPVSSAAARAETQAASPLTARDQIIPARTFLGWMTRFGCGLPFTSGDAGVRQFPSETGGRAGSEHSVRGWVAEST